MNRRKFLTGLIAAPAAAVLAPISNEAWHHFRIPRKQPELKLYEPTGDDYLEIYHDGTDMVIEVAQSKGKTITLPEGIDWPDVTIEKISEDEWTIRGDTIDLTL